MRRLGFLICALLPSLVLGQGFPPTSGSSGGSGVTTLGTVGGTPNATGGGISGTTYTAAPSSTVYAGMMAAADKAKLDALTGTCTGTNTGDVLIGSYSTTATSNPLTISGQTITGHQANASNPGFMSGADKTKLDAITGTHTGTCTGTNTGDWSLGASGSSANANGALLSSGVFSLQEASTSYAGLLGATDKTKLNAITGTHTGTNTGDVTVGTYSTTSASNPITISGQVVTAHRGDASNDGMMSSSDKTKLDAITGTHTGTNTGDAPPTVGTYSTTSTANVLTVSGSAITVHEADATNPGTVKAAWADMLAKLTPVAHPRTVAYQPGGANNSTGIAGQVYLEQIELGPVKGKMLRIGFLNGTTPGGNFYVGLYGPVDRSGAPPWTCQGAALVSTSATTSGSTGGAANNMLYASITTPVYHIPGLYCLAFETDGTSVNFYRQTQTRASKNAWQAFTQTWGALPSTVPTLSLTDEANNFPLLDEDIQP